MDFRVPMTELSVQVALRDSEAAEYQLFLAPFSDRHGGSESIEEYLNGARTFFPMVADGARRIVNRDQIVWLRIPSENAGEEADSHSVPEQPATLILADGSSLDGSMIIDKPFEQSRVSDVLNEPKLAFVRLDKDGSIYYVNKKFIRLAIPQ